LRRAVLSRVPDPVPAQVSGHGANDRHHVGYLGLLDIGHDHSRGHLLGVGVTVPTNMIDSDRRVLLRALLGPGATAPLRQLHAGRNRVLSLYYAPKQTYGLRPERWRTSSRTWVSATPMMLDRYPRNPRGLDEIGEVVAEDLVTAGYPAPAAVQPLPAAAVHGAVRRWRPGTLTGRPLRPVLHCRVVFDQPVRGPVLVGALRYLGGGLFVPEGDHADR
jgi:CRISPR-associated protein Csb2